VNGPTLTPCQTCHHCVQITACAHEDVLEIDGASNTGVDNVRELREAARFYPGSARFKVFIIDEVHMLSTGAFNALLKTLEEPPPQVVFILATTELHKVPNTVRSRCMIFSFKKVPADRIATYVKGILDAEGITYDDEAVAVVAREAKGSLRDSLSLLEQVIAHGGGRHLAGAQTRQALSVLGEDVAQSLFGALCAARADDALEALKSADESSIDLATLLDATAGFARAALVVKQVKDRAKAARLTQLLPSELDSLEAMTRDVGPVALGEFFRLLCAASRDAARSTNPLAWAEVAILDAISRADWLSAGELLGHLTSTSTGTPGQSPGRASMATSKGPTAVTTSPAGIAQTPGPSPALTPTPPPGSSPSGTRIDLAAISALIGRVEKQSPGLASKLRHAVFDEFHAGRVAFAATAQNALYSDFGEPDALLFVDALRAVGFGQAELAGIQLPRAVAWKPGTLERTTPSAAGLQPEGVPPTLPRAGFLSRGAAGKKKNNVTESSGVSALPFPPRPTASGSIAPGNDARPPPAHSLGASGAHPLANSPSLLSRSNASLNRATDPSSVATGIDSVDGTSSPRELLDANEHSSTRRANPGAQPLGKRTSNPWLSQSRGLDAAKPDAREKDTPPLPQPARSLVGGAVVESAPPTTIPVTAAPSNGSTTSLAAHERRERDKDFEVRSRRLLERPELRELQRVASRVSVLPLGTSTAGRG
jgi:DNA polymerase-3 subunit gamma/tau